MYQFTDRLLAWFNHHGRHNLPWQQDPTPYRVWISEVMLQQTQVATVIPYYQRFIARFPDVQTLAAAPLDEVLHLWTGLGYYARARNLRACAQVLTAQHGGEFPQGIFSVLALPGIGRSTAGAVLAISREERHPILDGNAKRVLARVFGIAGDPSSTPVLAQLWAAADACTPATNVRDYTQAIMDLGATVCSRTNPACTVCPMNDGCIAALEGRQSELPGKKQKHARGTREAILLLAQRGNDGTAAVLVERRPPAGLWGGLWSPPQFESEFAALDWVRREFGEPEKGKCIEQLKPIHHAFTHFDLRLNPLRVRCPPAAGAAARGGNVARGADAVRGGNVVRDRDDRLWYRLQDPPRVGLPQPILKLFQRLRDADIAADAGGGDADTDADTDTDAGADAGVR